MLIEQQFSSSEDRNDWLLRMMDCIRNASMRSQRSLANDIRLFGTLAIC